MAPCSLSWSTGSAGGGQGQPLSQLVLQPSQVGHDTLLVAGDKGVSDWGAAAAAALAQVVDFLESVDWCLDSFHPRLELKCQVQRIVPRLVQVASREMV